MQNGGRIHTVAKHTYKGKSLPALKAWSKALENSFYDEAKQIIYSIISDQDVKELGQLQSSHLEGLVETLNKVPEAKFAMFLKQEGDVIKGSLRSEAHKGVNVSTIAHKLGGGGHKFASELPANSLKVKFMKFGLMLAS
jgi:nanoRNase/pAp phosphatase (c-di-AMP/oligoRNAs hydrolase)